MTMFLFGRLFASSIFALKKSDQQTNKQLDKLFIICYNTTIDRPDVCSLVSISIYGLSRKTIYRAN